MLGRPNPYQSPQAATGRPWPVSSNPSFPILAELAYQGFLYRCIRLSGGLDADVEWNGRWPIETIRLNGKKTASTSPGWYTPHFSFVIEATSSHHQFDIDVRLSTFAPILVKGFRVRIDGTAVYSEGKWADVSESPSV